VRGPVGSLEPPDEGDEFIQFSFEDLVFHIQKILIDELPDDGGQILVSMGGYGKKAIDIDMLKNIFP